MSVTDQLGTKSDTTEGFDTCIMLVICFEHNVGFDAFQAREAEITVSLSNCYGRDFHLGYFWSDKFGTFFLRP